MKNILKYIKEGANKIFHVIKTNGQKLNKNYFLKWFRKKPIIKSSAFVAASMGRSAVDAVRHHSSKMYWVT